MSTVPGEKKPWENKSNRLISVIEVSSKPADHSLIAPVDKPFSSYYTLDKLT
jgi:hypothetical protein